MPKKRHKKGDIIHYKEDEFEGLLEVITNERNNQCTIIFFTCEDITEEIILKTTIGKWTKIKAKAKDLALYTHWPNKTKRFWELLEGTLDV